MTQKAQIYAKNISKICVNLRFLHHLRSYFNLYLQFTFPEEMLFSLPRIN